MPVHRTPGTQWCGGYSWVATSTCRDSGGYPHHGGFYNTQRSPAQGMDHTTGVERRPDPVTSSARVCRVEARDEDLRDLESTLPLHPPHWKAPEGVDGRGRHPPCLPPTIKKKLTPDHTGSHPEVPCDLRRLCTWPPHPLFHRSETLLRNFR